MIFVDIGCETINLGHVVNMYRMGESITIVLDVQDGDGPLSITLRDDEAEAFRNFWATADIPGLTIWTL